MASSPLVAIGDRVAQTGSIILITLISLFPLEATLLEHNLISLETLYVLHRV
jgi:hypothetical protein